MYIGLLALPSLALSQILVHPDDPFAYLAATATSYEEWADRIAAVATTNGPPVPSPSLASAAADTWNQTLSGKCRFRVHNEITPRVRPVAWTPC